MSAEQKSPPAEPLSRAGDEEPNTSGAGVNAADDSGTSRTHKPFVPSWLDDAGLPVSAFRVVCNLWRRADRASGECWPSIANIARTCQLERKTVFAALGVLVGRGLVQRMAVPGRSTRYRPIVPTHPVWPPIPKNGTGSKTGHGVVGQTGRHPSRSAYHEGIPEKVLQRSESSEGVAHTLALSEQDRTELREEFDLRGAALDRALGVYTENKTPYIAKDGPLSVSGFKGWLRTSRHGRAISRRGNQTAGTAHATGSNGNAEQLQEPAGWRDDPNCPVSPIERRMRWDDPAFSRNRKLDVIKFMEGNITVDDGSELATSGQQ